MNALIELSPDVFEHREWVALQWVCQYLTHEGTFPNKDLPAAFEQLYTTTEQTCVFAVFKLMFFFNMLANSVFKDQYETGTACAIEPNLDE